MPSPDRSARTKPLTSGVPIVHPVMSTLVFPSPFQFTASVLLNAVSLKPALRDTRSVTRTDVFQSTILWLGGQISPPLAVPQVTVGGVRSILMARGWVMPVLPATSVASPWTLEMPSALTTQEALAEGGPVLNVGVPVCVVVVVPVVAGQYALTTAIPDSPV